MQSSARQPRAQLKRLVLVILGEHTGVNQQKPMMVNNHIQSRRKGSQLLV